MKEFFGNERRVLAYFWSLISAVILIYVVIHYGNDKATLNLILGLLGGTVLGGIFSLYFGSSIDAVKKQATTIPPIPTPDNTIPSPEIPTT